MNTITIVGRVGKVDLQCTQNGDAVLNFSVATTMRIDSVFDTQWYQCSMWGQRAENICEYVEKGNFVGVTGQLQINHYENKHGDLVTSLAINVTDLTLAGASKNENKASDYKRNRETQSTGKGSSNSRNAKADKRPASRRRRDDDDDAGDD